MICACRNISIVIYTTYQTINSTSHLDNEEFYVCSIPLTICVCAECSFFYLFARATYVRQLLLVDCCATHSFIRFSHQTASTRARVYCAHYSTHNENELYVLVLQNKHIFVFVSKIVSEQQKKELLDFAIETKSNLLVNGNDKRTRNTVIRER